MKSHAEAMDQAFADHERHHHGGPDPVQPPMACLTDVAARYDAIVLTEIRDAWNTPPRSDESNEDWEARRDTMVDVLLNPDGRP